jgi:hypothetical protein
MRALLIKMENGIPVGYGPHTRFTCSEFKVDILLLLCSKEEINQEELVVFRECLSTSTIGRVLTLDDLVEKSIQSFEPSYIDRLKMVGILPRVSP